MYGQVQGGVAGYSGGVEGEPVFELARHKEIGLK